MTVFVRSCTFCYFPTFFSSVDPLELRLSVLCSVSEIHYNWNTLMEFIFCPKQRVLYMKDFLIYNINKVYLQCKLSDAKG